MENIPNQEPHNHHVVCIMQYLFFFHTVRVTKSKIRKQGTESINEVNSQIYWYFQAT